ncbi:NfeD family protein [Isachenkonia alkalipeptolytica]|uniref:Nodulation protein NfeD n=1 Tax=Isachenkonia alkalipeptolytica TaxID=2565777 RepID=A0AA43XM66_9CLOT|nr:nodulation protein NfeD [Isachenkonia alkalipeptolytica]NBG89328.1 nodulation protein NfeD [Isachenkonia alkalipeptolytica]
MKTKSILSFVLIIVFAFSLSFTEAQDDEGTVYVIPIEGEINAAVYEYVRQSIEEVESDPEASGIIFEIDTYGGRVDSAEDLSPLMMRTDLPTVSFVNTRAISAGVLITISSDFIAMSPGSNIGSAETIPDTEKVLSSWVASLRGAAQETGRDPEIVAAMADKSMVIDGLVEEGRLLNLTAQEALDLEFTDIRSASYEEMLEQFEIPYNRIEQMEMPFRARISQFATGTAVAPILLSLGFMGLVFEVFTPGLGAGAIIGLSSFSLYFIGSLLAGDSGLLAIILFGVGIILLLVEATIPGLGIPGISGGIAIIVSIVLSASSPAVAVVYILIALVLTIATFVLMLKFGPKNKLFDKITLKSSERVEDGYTSTDPYVEYIGKEGVVISYLRPSGTVKVDGKLLNVVTEGSSFIEEGAKVIVTRTEGSKIYVSRNEEEGM